MEEVPMMFEEVEVQERSICVISEPGSYFISVVLEMTKQIHGLLNLV